MSIRPVEFNGMLQRTEDVSQMKHQEDAKPIVDQQNIQQTVDQRADAMRHQVVDANQSDGAQNNADARDEGKGTYFDNRKKREKEKEEKNSDGRVIRKVAETTFDIKI
ncbi:MAG: hypothetical protein E7282_06335 [Lachnospiraceae bacterium]|nr:hypothetical protein [Lachnospiraceae bacterium]